MLRIIKVLTLFLSLMWLCPMVAMADSQFVVVIDPGHGGGDPGTLHRKCKQDEKVIALNVATKLGKLITEKYPEVKIVYTRTTDIYPTLPDRTRIAREAKGNLFISIHVNAAGDSRAKGVETYVFGITGLQGKSAEEQQRIRERTMAERENLDIDGKQIDFETAVDIETKILCQTQREKHNKYSLEVAHYVQDNIMSSLRHSEYRSHAHDRGVKQKNIFVLCYSPMPAILIELGYMTNTQEEKFMNTDKAQELYANAIFKGFEQYRNNWCRRQLKEGEDGDWDIMSLALGDSSTEGTTASVPTTTVITTPATTPAAEPTPKPTPVAQPVQQPVVEKQTPVVNTAAETKQTVTTQPVAAQTKNNTPQTQTPVTQTQSAATQTKPVETQTAVAQTQKQVTTPQKQEPVKTQTAQTDINNLPKGSPVPLQPAKECYRIQFMSSASHFKKGDAPLKGLWPVQCYKVDNYYRYTYGEGITRGDLHRDLQHIRKLFSDAFIVHFDAQGKRIP